MIGLLEDNRDEFARYDSIPESVGDLKTFNPIDWWNNSRIDFPTLHLWAFDTLAIPAMSAECERVFSSIKKLITPERNRLHMDIIEASECLKNWWDYRLIQQRDYAPEDPDPEDFELQDDEDDDCEL
jgi:hAT family C-terminal dimerisation region